MAASWHTRASTHMHQIQHAYAYSTSQRQITSHLFFFPNQASPQLLTSSPPSIFPCRHMHAWPSHSPSRTHACRPTSDRSGLTSLQLTQTGLQKRKKKYKKSPASSPAPPCPSPLSVFFSYTPLLKKETTDTFTHLHLTFFPHPSAPPHPHLPAIPQCSLQGGYEGTL